MEDAERSQPALENHSHLPEDIIVADTAITTQYFGSDDDHVYNSNTINCPRTRPRAQV